jgi:hypothetical protein
LFTDHRDPKVLQVVKDHKELLALPVLRELREHKVRQVHRALPVLKVCKGLLVLKGNKVYRVLPAHKVLQDRKA